MHKLLIAISFFIVSGCSSTQHKDMDYYSYNLDVPSKRYSSLDFKSVGEAAVVKIRASFIEQRKSPEWNPSASFQLFSNDGNGYAALVIPNREGDNYQPFLIVKSKDPETKEIISSDPVYFDEKLDFNKEFSLHVTWYSDESLLVTINEGETKSVPLNFVVGKLRSSNSSGEIDVLSLTIEKCNKSKHADAASCAGV